MTSSGCAECDQLQLITSHSQPSRPITFQRSLIVGSCLGALAAIYAVTIPFVLPAFRRICLPYLPATRAQIANILAATERAQSTSRFKSVYRVIDLGSGDGRVVVAVANKFKNFQVDGVELNPWLVWYSRLAAWRMGAKARFHRTDLWKVDLGQYDKVIVFGVAEMMAELEDKLKNELKPESEVIACRFSLEEWPLEFKIGAGIDSVWVYRKGSSKS